MSAAETPLRPVGEGVWIAMGPAHILGMRLTSTMTLLRLADGSLLVHSPIALEATLRMQVQAVGEVAHLYCPNLFHHLHARAWAEAFPGARVHAPRGLEKKRPDLRIDRTHGAPLDAAFDGVIEEVRIEGFRVGETVLLHRPSRTLVVTDLVHNVGRPDGAWAKLYTRAMGFYDRVALSKMIRWTAFSDPRAARRSLDYVASLPFDRLIVGHGEPLETGGKAALAEAFAWLPPTGD